MRNTHLAWSWELWVVLFVCFMLASATTLFADQDSQKGMILTVTGVSFKTLMNNLASENGLKLIIQTDDDPSVNADFSNPTPVLTIMKQTAKDVGLDFWQEGDTYYIGKQKTIAVTPTPTIDHAPTPDPGPSTPVPAPSSILTTPLTVNNAQPKTTTAEPVIGTIPLQYMSVRELLYMLGQSSDTIESSRRQVLDNRIETVYDGKHPHDLNLDRSNNSSSTSAGTSPWLGAVTGQLAPHDAGTTDAYQFPGFPGMPSPTPGLPGNPTTPGNPTAPGTPNNPNNPNRTGTPGAPGAPGATGSGGLKSFVPDGVREIVGLVGLNKLMVKAETQDDIDKLADLIKLLDKPLDQVVVEVMFVDMNIQDAMSMSASMQYSGMPVAFVSNNGGTAGNMLLSYVKGDVTASMSAIVTKSWNKVVNAPRVVVQNNGTASVMFTTYIPFITLDEEEDIFGRTMETPQIEMQQFEQGLTVNNVIIHPDDTVTLNVTPIITSPAATGVPIPGGGAGQVFGSNTVTIQTVVRVKNGETIMMGGFATKNETRQVTETPLLGKIPLIGPLLFGSHANTNNDEETMIFLTPTIMKEDTTDFSGLSALPPLF